MLKETLEALLSRLSATQFESFAVEYFNLIYGAGFQPFARQGLPMYKRRFPAPSVGRYVDLEGVYIVDYLPLDLIREIKYTNVRSEPLITALLHITNEYKNRRAYPHNSDLKSVLQRIFFLNNLVNLTDEIQRYIFPQYISLAKEANLPIYPWEHETIQIGNIGFWIETKPYQAEQALKSVLQRTDGIAIRLRSNDLAVNRYTADKYLISGVAGSSHDGYESLYTIAHQQATDILNAFERLLKENATESKLEEFLKAHYNDVFGPQYDRVETQLWLRFPHIDITSQHRRLDVFVRNAVVNDWELFEIKRAIPLAGTYRDVPVLSREIHGAIQQIRNYSRILADDRVKRHFAAQGIEYYEPALHLVVGRTPTIPHEQWRWLASTAPQDVKIFTYDRLLAETRARLMDRLSIFDIAKDAER
jgi:hypothetical protein